MSRWEQMSGRIRDAWRAVRRLEDRGSEEWIEPARAAPAPDPVIEEQLPTAVVPDDHPLVPLSRHDDALVSRGIRIAAAWSWRLLVIAVAAGALLWLLAYIRLIVVPLVIALLLSALLEPAAAWLRRVGVPRSLAAAIVLIGGLGAVVGILTAVINAFIDGVPELYGNVQEGIVQIESWLRTGPLQLSERQLDQAFASAREWLDENRKAFTAGAVDTATETATTVGHVLAGIFLVLFTSFFFMRDGRNIWQSISSMFPSNAQADVYGAGNAAWRSLTSYVRATVVVAAIDAVGIGLGAAILGLPLAFPIGALVFLASFVPIVGATVSGIVAVLVALVVKGPFVALVMLLIVIGVQQVEGHVLQPLLLGRAVALHPVAVIIAIGAGVVVAGIVGALIAVPTVAVLNTAFRYLRGQRPLETEVRPG
ncbi:MAG: AI-2E family transporter [Micromonosporaceae bacterium]